MGYLPRRASVKVGISLSLLFTGFVGTLLLGYYVITGQAIGLLTLSSPFIFLFGMISTVYTGYHLFGTRV